MDKITRDRKNGCQACVFEKDNPLKKSRTAHTCGKDETINKNNMCRQSQTPMEYKHQELMNELNEFMISAKVWIHSDKFGEAAERLKETHAKPDIKYFDSLQQRINQVLQQDATPFVKYLQEPMDVKSGPHPGITEY